MSGGAFDYKYTYLDIYEGETEDEQIEELLQDMRKLLHDLEWYKSGDTNQEDYRASVADFKEKWLMNKPVLNVIKRICSDEENYLNIEYGSDKNKLYIDGCTEYLDEHEKYEVVSWLNEDK